MGYKDYVLDKTGTMKDLLNKTIAKSKVEWLALQMGISAARLYQQKSLTNARDLFHLENLPILVHETGDFSILDFLESLAGRVAFAVPHVETLPEVNAEIGKAIQEFGELIQEAAHDLADGRIDKTELAQIEKEGQEAIRQIAKLLEAVRQVSAGARPLKVARQGGGS